MSYSLTTKYPIVIPAVGKTNSATNSFTAVGVLTGTKTGEKVDDWKTKVQKGLPASSPYYLNAYKLVLGPELRDIAVMHDWDRPAIKTTSTFTGYPGAAWTDGTTAHLVVDSSRAKSVALSKLYKKLESDRSGFNAYASLAEITDVLRQFGRPYAAIVDAFMRHENRLIFEKRRLVGSKTFKDEKFSKIAAETWLETSFGLIPLLSDAESVAEAFGRFEFELAEKPALRTRMRTRAIETTKAITTMALKNATSGLLYYAVEKEVETRAKAQYVVGLEGEVRAEFGTSQRLKELLGFEPRNLPLAVWEATPWSWLVDYGTNVQQILAAGATITTRVKWIVLSETTQTLQTFRSKNALAGNASYILESFVSNRKDPKRAYMSTDGPKSLAPGDFRIIRTTFSRTLPASLGLPPLYFHSPLQDVKKVANLAALVIAKRRDHQTWLS